MHSDHGSLIRTKWFYKTIEAVGALSDNPLDPRKTRAQFHNDLFACELNLVERYFMMFGYDTKT